MNKQYEKFLDQQISKGNHRFHLGALVIQQGRVVGAGYNRVYRIGPYSYTADCAEALALKKTPCKLRQNAIVIVARKAKDGTLRMAKPCARCQKMLAKAGISKVYFTTPDGWNTIRLGI